MARKPFLAWLILINAIVGLIALVAVVVLLTRMEGKEARVKRWVALAEQGREGLAGWWEQDRYLELKLSEQDVRRIVGVLQRSGIDPQPAKWRKLGRIVIGTGGDGVVIDLSPGAEFALYHGRGENADGLRVCMKSPESLAKLLESLRRREAGN